MFPSLTQVPNLRLYSNSSLYVGDLEPSITEKHLLDLFTQIAPVHTLRVFQDQIRYQLGYAHVTFATPEDARLAMERLNYIRIKGRPIRIMLLQRDRSEKANVFIKNLDASIDNRSLFDTFSSFGTILSCKVAIDVFGKSKGYGFVQFEKEESAQAAIEKLNGMLLNGKQVFVGQFVRRQDRTTVQRYTNVYVKNLPKDMTEDELKKMFGEYGDITSVVVMKDRKGRCFGFVNFESHEAAAIAIEKMNGVSLGEEVLFVGKAQKKSEREEELRRKFKQERISMQGLNLYLKNLDGSVNDEKLKEIFSEHGNVTSCKVMLTSQGLSRGFGFVAFSKAEEASKAMKEMNGKMIGKKSLYISLAQSKEDRLTQLRTFYSQMMRSSMSGFHHHPPGGPVSRPHHPMFISHNGQGPVPSHGYQSPFIHGAGPCMSPANFMRPCVLQRQNQHGPRVGYMGAPNIHQLFQQQHQQILQQNVNLGMRSFMQGTNNMRNGVGAYIPQPQGNMPLPLDASAISRNAPQHQHKLPLLPISDLISALASANPTNHSPILGDQLYPLVKEVEPVQATKVTGMLLEMNQAEILHLLESPEALKAKVSEALDVLRSNANPPSAS